LRRGSVQEYTKTQEWMVYGLLERV
jgi:hypothetical protein